MSAYPALVCNPRGPGEDVRSIYSLLLGRAARHINQGHHSSRLDGITFDPHLFVSQL